MTELNAAIRGVPRPPRIKRLPVNERGFPIPWFVYIDKDGVADFRVIGPNKIYIAHMKHLCWICGEPLGVHRAFTIGPMCVVNRVNSEPPSHLACAEYAVRTCPFLSNPRTRRNEKDLPAEGQDPAGIAIMRNPGATAIYVTQDYKPFKVNNGILFRLGEPERVMWYAYGRDATRVEVEDSINSGLPLLLKMAEADGPEAVTELAVHIAQVWPLLP